MEKSETSYIAVGNVKWCNQFGKVWKFLKMLSTESPYAPAIPSLCMYLREWNNAFTQKLEHEYSE